MEKHTCKLCFRHFNNGRALGGHMRSHVTAAGAAAPARKPRVVLPDSSASSSSTSFREAEEDEEQAAEQGVGLGYGLRENPRKSFRLVDPEFSSFFVVMDAASSVVQDRESETESPRAPSFHRRRSKRPRRFPPPEAPEPEPVSSVSDATPEEDVANSLMMLSRDVWTKSPEAEEQQQPDGSDHDYYDEAEEEQIAGGSQPSNHHHLHDQQQQQQQRRRYQCETCKKVFRSYQALGGHRASHKKLKQVCAPAAQIQIPDANSSDANADRASKVHECQVCFRVFTSGQALGGHKRSHLCSSATAAITITSSPSLPPPPSPPSTSTATAKYESLIDLNLPAPMDEDTAELSTVSDAEFVVGGRSSH